MNHLIDIFGEEYDEEPTPTSQNTQHSLTMSNAFSSTPNFLEDEEMDELDAKALEENPYDFSRGAKTHTPKRPSGRTKSDGSNKTSVSQSELFLLAYMNMFRFITARQVAIVTGVLDTSATKKLSRLTLPGFVQKVSIPAAKDGYTITKKGRKALHDAGQTFYHERAIYKPGQTLGHYQHNIAVAQVVAVELSGCGALSKIQPIETFDNETYIARNTYAYTRDALLNYDLKKIFVPEAYIQSAWSKQVDSFNQSRSKSVLLPHHQARLIHEGFETKGRNREIGLRDLFNQDPISWASENIYSNISRLGVDFRHTVDLVINLEHTRTRWENPVSIGVEVELTAKSSEEYQKIFDVHYDSSRRSKRFKKIVWYTHSPYVASTIKKSLEKWLNAAGPHNEDKRNFFEVLPLPDVDGPFTDELRFL